MRINWIRFYFSAALFVWVTILAVGIAQAGSLRLPAPSLTAAYHQTQASATEVAFWESVRNSKNADEIEAYLQAYPNGVFVPLARIRIKTLRGKKTTSTPVGKKSNKEPRANQVSRTTALGETIERLELKIKIAERAGTREGMLGVQVWNIDKSIAKGLGLRGSSGAFVSTVTRDGAAQQAGIKPLDTIVSFDGRPILNIRQLVLTTRATPPGTIVRVEILRPSGGHTQLTQRLQVKVEQGDADATTALAWLYEFGASIERDDRKAFGLYRKAAEAGNLTAMFRLGTLLAAGRGGSADKAEAINWVRKAAQGGNHQAMYALARSYESGGIAHKDQAEAMRWYRKAAEQGNSPAMYVLGLRYLNGKSVEKDDAEAVIWFRRASEKGHGDGTNALGIMYRWGRGVYRNKAEALRLLRKAVDLGSINALYNLASMLQAGEGTTKNEAEAFRLYQRAVDQKHARATVALALMYQNGKGVARDYTKALRLHRRAAEMNSPTAFHYLGWMYAHGHGTPKDNTKAANWYRKGAEAGLSASMLNLAIAYEWGRGVPKSSRTAAEWIYKSLEKGNKVALKNMIDNNQARAWSKRFRRDLQRRLKAAGYYTGPIDGSFGSGTKSAIEALVSRKM